MKITQDRLNQQNNASNLSVLLIGGYGYIGSYLQSKLQQAGISYSICDDLRRGNPLGIRGLEQDYSMLGVDYCSQFDVVLWFAGHSSVQRALDDPVGALDNNCINLFRLARNLNPSTKLIYASTASLYSSIKSGDVLASSEKDLVQIPYQNAYDMSKFTFDYMSENFLSNCYAIRMGTVSGFSPNLRAELLFNAMNISAVTKGEVIVKNKNSYRTILLLDDLWLLIKALLERDAQPGVYNAGSFSGTIGQFSKWIASAWDARVVDQGSSETYSFLLDTSRMDELIECDRIRIPIEQHSRNFIDDCRSANSL